MDRVTFKVNGKQYTVGNEVPAETSLASYLRYHAQLTDTKTMCHEGSCGACILTVSAMHPVSKEMHTFSVNACVILVFSCDGWDITTAEGVGNRLKGYHAIQKRLTELNGTQCGFCTPGWVNQMYSILDKKLTMEGIENSFGSNTCRCTGYRSILDAMKTFAVDATPELLSKLKDIEDVPTFCSKKNTLCNKKCLESDAEDWCLLELEDAIKDVKVNAIKVISFKNHTFYMVENIEDIFSIFQAAGTDSYMLIAGNIGKGKMENFQYPKVLIDINRIEELRTHQIDQNLIVGAGMTIEDMRTLFVELSKTKTDFTYLSQLALHLELVGNGPLNNVGTIAGNLMLKNENNLYWSDLFLIFATAGAMLTIRSANGITEIISMEKFLKYDMKGKIIYRVSLPPLGSDYYFRSYKIMPRNQNSNAIVNAGFLLKINNNIIKSASIVFGGINGDFVHAMETEDFVKNKNIFNNNILQQTINILKAELNPVENPPDPPADVRKKIALGLFYKMVLNLCPKTLLNSKYLSGREVLARGLSSGKQSYDTDSADYPVNEPVPKLEGLIQSAGEAQYVNDIPAYANQVFGAFVLSTVSSGEIDTIDQTEILAMEGVLAVYTAKDIPGKNRFIKPSLKYQTFEERLLADAEIKYHGEPIAIVVADTEQRAALAAKLLKVTYKNVSSSSPLLQIEEAKKDPTRVLENKSKNAQGRGTDVYKNITGICKSERQFHYSLETQCCVVMPVDRGITVYSSTEWIQLTHMAVAEVLNMPLCKIQMVVRRIGGGFGGKLSRSGQVAAACALVSKIRNVPCRFVLPLETNLTAIGARAPCYADYNVGFDQNGKIQFADVKLWTGDGCSHDENYITSLAVDALGNCYDDQYWGCQGNSVLTDLPSSTIMRAPGATEAISVSEQIMEHVAFTLNKDPLEVKLANMRKTDNLIPELIEQLKKDAEYESRLAAVENYNKNNRWMKKSIKVSCVDFKVKYLGNISAFVTVFEGDGTVVVSSGGIEMGQGMNTKVAQVCAKTLDIPVSSVNVEPSSTVFSGNDIYSTNSGAEEIVCYCVIQACEILKKRLSAYRLLSLTWKEAIATAGKSLVDLKAQYQFSKSDLNDSYINQAVVICEVQTDLLTGQHLILRVDLLQDAGTSINPLMDVGQVEGAYVQGLGYWLSERVVNDSKTGKLYTNGAWNYNVPLAKDIPIKFNVKLRANNNNKNGVTGAKSVADISLCLANGAMFALRECIHESRRESGYAREWIDIVPPYDVETIISKAAVKSEEFLIQ